MGARLRDRINDELKQAMRSKNKVRLSTLRLIMAAFKDRDIQSRGTGKDDAPTEDDLISIMTRMIKQRREAAETYMTGGRPELAGRERAEIAIIEEFLPRQMDEAETQSAVTALITELGCTGLRDMGKVMAELKQRYQGTMNMSAASALVKKLLA